MKESSISRIADAEASNLLFKLIMLSYTDGQGLGWPEGLPANHPGRLQLASERDVAISLGRARRR